MISIFESRHFLSKKHFQIVPAISSAEVLMTHCRSKILVDATGKIYCNFETESSLDAAEFESSREMREWFSGRTTPEVVEELLQCSNYKHLIGE